MWFSEVDPGMKWCRESPSNDARMRRYNEKETRKCTVVEERSGTFVDCIPTKPFRC